MAGQVDPYRDWLGVTAVERPPSHYALLGLEELESDPRTIGEATRRAKKVLRSYQVGPYRMQALAVLTEVGQAIETLTNAQKKAAYDRDRHTRLLELAEANFPQAELNRPLDEMFADWIVQCDKAGLPVPVLMAELMQWCLERAFKWPTRGPHKAPLPLGLWIYFEAAVIGQCVQRSPLEARVRAVKGVQQAFGITEQLSRVINLDIARRPQSFAGSPLVRAAADRPRDVMQNWVDLLAARGLGLDEKSPTYAVLAFLLGLADEEGRPVAEPVRPTVVQPRAPSAAAAAWQRVADQADRLGTWLREKVTDIPGFVMAVRLAILVALAILFIVFVLLVVLSR